MSLSEAALTLARQGFRIHPLEAGQKTPMLKVWQQQATRDLGVIDSWWQKWPRANVGIACGDGVFVLDEDPRHGSEAAISALELINGDLPATRTVLTPSGGKHRYFRHPADVTVRNSASKIGKGLDIRGQGGYVVSSPSTLVASDKQTAGEYRNDGGRPIAQAPQWLLDLVTAPHVEPVHAEPPKPVGASFDEMRKLLEGEKGYADHDDWLKVGMAIHHETQGSEEGFALWCEWSAQWDKYPGAQELRPRWKSFQKNAANAVTLGSLRRNAVASIEEFPVVAPTEHEAVDCGVDTRPAAIIQRLLESRLVFVSGQSAYFDLEANTGELLSDYTVRHIFCPKLPVIITDTPKGPKYTKVDPIDYLKESKTKQVVSAIGLHPGEGRFFEEDGRRYVNRYTPAKAEMLRPKPQELDAFNFIWHRMTDAPFRNWLMKFFAHALQKPGVKIRSAPLLWSNETGTGKNTIMRIIPGLLYGEQWIGEMSNSVLSSQFNDQLGETWWLYLEELRAGSTKTERIMAANKLKSWITDNTLQIHPKGRKPYWIRNRLQLLATSNFDDAVQIDNTDRRWGVSEILDKPLTERESMDLYQFLDGPRAAGVLRYIFANVSTVGFNPAGRAPVTQGKRAMIQAGLGNWESDLLTRMANQEAPFNRDLFQLPDVLQFVGGHGLTVHRLGRLLQRAPFNCVKLRSSAERMWAWKNTDQWRQQSAGAMRAHMETGARPPGPDWSDAVPAAIVEMAPEGDGLEVVPEKADNYSDLLS